MWFGEPMAVIDAKTAQRFYTQSPERFARQPEDTKGWMRRRIRDEEDAEERRAVMKLESEGVLQDKIREARNIKQQVDFLSAYMDSRRLLVLEFYENIFMIRTNCDRNRIDGRPFKPFGTTFKNFGERKAPGENLSYWD